jgi:1-acyl-sn-glycerol-3-phosphate acyltransferase
MQEAKQYTVKGTSEKFIDIRKVIGNKNPRLLKILPFFIINYLKRILHEDEINAFICRHSDKFGLDFVKEIVFEFSKSVEVHGLENIPANERIIIASNHPLGGLDGVALMHVAGKVRKDILFPVNDILMNLQNIKNLFIPINKHGTNAQNLKIINDTFASDVSVLYFPAGLCSRKQNHGIIKDLEWKKTFISYAKKYKRNIVPTFIVGRNSDFFYNLANFRKRIGLKQNIEMLYLVNEFYKHKDKSLDIYLGKSISYKVFDKRMPDIEWAEKVREHVYKLKDNNKIEFEF